MTWKAPRILYENNDVRQEVLRAVRRHHARRRCVQWASLPSTCAISQLQEQAQQSHTPKNTNTEQLLPLLLLTSAHATRPGWRAPVLLVVHNVDLLDSEEVNVLAQLCSRFAFPNPHLQLLVSFDHPHWPVSPLAAIFERMGGCAVQLRSLLLPRVHELQHVNSIHLLTEFEAAAAASSSGGGGRGRGWRGANAAGGSSSSGTDVSAVAAASSGGSSYLLHDTMRRVLFSLPPAFNSLLRILLDVQDEAGDGVFVSLFTVTARFEKSGVMISQGRLRALLRELTSNRIAKYDPAEHALMVPQVARLRKVLEEVMAQRDSGAASGTPE